MDIEQVQTLIAAAAHNEQPLDFTESLSWKLWEEGFSAQNAEQLQMLELWAQADTLRCRHDEYQWHSTREDSPFAMLNIVGFNIANPNLRGLHATRYAVGKTIELWPSIYEQ